MLNLAMLLEISARRTPAKVAVMLDDTKLRYAELNGAANKIANGLVKLGVRAGDKVALMLPNTPHFVMCYYAILKLGATVVPLNVLFKRHEVAYHLDDSDAVALIVWEGFLGEAAEGAKQASGCRNLIVAQAPGSQAELPAGALPLGALMVDTPPTFDTVPTMPDDTAVILYTSGTTGRPKGAELSHLNMLFNAYLGAEKILRVGPDEVGLAVLPLFHSFGQTCVMNALIYAGGTITLLPRFEPQKALEVLVRDRVTYFAGVPTMYFYLLHFPGADSYDLSALRRLWVSPFESRPMVELGALNDADDPGVHVFAVDQAMPQFPPIVLADPEYAELCFGRRVADRAEVDGRYRLYADAAGFVGLGRVDHGILRADRLMATA